MSAFDELFESCILQVVSPQASLEFPKDYQSVKAAEWLSRLGEPSTDRTTAFFGSCHTSTSVLLCVRRGQFIIPWLDTLVGSFLSFPVALDLEIVHSCIHCWQV